jgi:hypothetical protein
MVEIRLDSKEIAQKIRNQFADKKKRELTLGEFTYPTV